MEHPAHHRGRFAGPQALQGAAGTYILGVLLHFFIAFSAASITTRLAFGWIS